MMNWVKIFNQIIGGWQFYICCKWERKVKFLMPKLSDAATFVRKFFMLVEGK